MQELKEDFEKSGGMFEKFRIGELFDIHPTKSYGLTNSKLFASKGNTPVVVNSSINNGVGGYADLPPTEKANTITFSDTTSADSIFLQDEDFIGYSHVQGLYPREENKWTSLSLLYFVAVFKHIAKQYNFDYAYKFNRKIAMSMTVLLPTKEKELAFSYMEQYIREVEAELVREAEDESAREVEAYLLAGGFSDCELTETERAALERKPSFEIKKLTDIFAIKNTSNLIARQIVENSGETPYLCASSSNNAVSSYISADKSYLNKGNCIFIGGKSFVVTYQALDFYSNDSHNLALYLKDNHVQNEENSLFMATCIQKSLGHRYYWGDSISYKKAQSDIVCCPINASGEIDFAYMQAYISAIKKLVIADVAKRKERELAAMHRVIQD